MQRRLFLRVFVQATTEELARVSLTAITSVLGPFTEIIDVVIKPYWKISDQYELFFDLSPKTNLPDTFRSVSKSLGDGWIAQEDLESIWKADRANCEFCCPTVRWAHLEGIHQLEPRNP